MPIYCKAAISASPRERKDPPIHSRATYLDIRILPTLSLSAMQIWISAQDGFDPGQPGAAKQLLQGRIESNTVTPGSVMLAVPNGVREYHEDITTETAALIGSEREKHTQADDQRLLDGGGGLFGFPSMIVSATTSFVWGTNPLETPAGRLRFLNSRRTMVERETVAMLGLGKSPVAHIPSQLCPASTIIAGSCCLTEECY